MFFLLCCCAPGFTTEARQRTQKSVQSERRAATQKIEQARKNLTKNEQETRRELLNLQALEGEIRERETEASRLSAEAAALQRRSKIACRQC